MTKINVQGEDIPTKSGVVVDSLKKGVIKFFFRYSWWPPKESAVECDILESEVFSYTEGPILIYLQSGKVVGVASDESLNSVVVWFERDSNGGVHEEDIENDEELHLVSFDDQVYSNVKWRNFVNKKVDRVEIIKRKPITVKYNDLPNEVGLKFHLIDGSDFIIGHQLSGKNTNLSIIDSNELDNFMPGELEYIYV